jgi:hypothetical protein
MKVGMQLGARVMQVGEQQQFSGALYPFSLWSGRQALARLHELQDRPSVHKEDKVFSAGLTLIECWLEQYLLPPPMPELIDHYTGEPMLFSTDHYAVRDWDTLTASLAAQPDVFGERDTGWDRTLDCKDGQTRSLASINTKPGSQRVSVQYRTAGMAEKGRAWFDALVGDAVKFELREVSDPRGMLLHGKGQNQPAPARYDMPAGLDADSLANAIETALLRTYANWADEPIPVLGNRTPRQAMKSASGLERVKGLLRSYEDGEAQQAVQQGRRTVSYQFLWDALGLER